MKLPCVAIIIIQLILLPVSAKAVEPTQCTEATSVSDPCIGVLLPEAAAADGIRCLEIDLPRLTLSKETLEGMHQIRIDSLTALLNSERLRGDRLSGLLDTAIEVKEAPSFWEHPAFWFALGFVVATATTVGITFAVNEK